MEEISDCIYSDLYPQIEECLERIEENPSFKDGISRLKTVEVSIEVLKNNERRIISKELYQHEWSWLKSGGLLLAAALIINPKISFIPPILYQCYSYHCSTYSREKAQQLIKKTIIELTVTENFSKEDIVKCAIKVNTANPKFFTWGYWVNYTDDQKSICSNTFTKIS